MAGMPGPSGQPMMLGPPAPAGGSVPPTLQLQMPQTDGNPMISGAGMNPMMAGGMNLQMAHVNPMMMMMQSPAMMQMAWQQQMAGQTMPTVAPVAPAGSDGGVSGIVTVTKDAAQFEIDAARAHHPAFKNGSTKLCNNYYQFGGRWLFKRLDEAEKAVLPKKQKMWRLCG